MIDSEPTAVEEQAPPRPSLKHNAVARFLAGGAAMFATLASGIAIARALGPEGKGIAGLLALVASVALISIDLGLTTAGVYFVGRKKFTAQNVVSTYLTAGAVLGLVLAFTIAAVSHPLADLLFKGKYSSLILLLAIGMPLVLMNHWLTAVVRGQERLVPLSLIHIAESVVRLIVLVLALFALNLREISIIWSINATAAFGLIATVALLMRHGIKFRFGMDWQLLRESVNYGLRGQIGQILQFINYRFDLFVVNKLLGPASVGIYSVGAAVSTVIWQIPDALAYALYSRVSSVDPEEGNRTTMKVARQSMILSTLAALAFIPIGYVAIPYLYGEDFRPAVVAMCLMLPGVVALSYYKVLGVHMAGQGRPEYLSYSAGVSAVLTIALDFLLIPKMGINGAAIASSIAYTLSAGMSIFWFARVSKVKGIHKLFVPEAEDFTAWLRIIKSFKAKDKV